MQEDADKIYHYLGPDNIATRMSLIDPDSLKATRDLNDITTLTRKDIRKVTRDPKFDFIADNLFPTVFGKIGIVNKPYIPSRALILLTSIIEREVTAALNMKGGSDREINRME